jgi:uncharacterized protein (TIGR02246 family)
VVVFFSLKGGVVMNATTFALAVLSTVLLFAAGFAAARSAEPAKDADEKAIRSLIARMLEEWNQHDMKSFSSNFADDGDSVNRFGHWLRGRAKIEEHLIELHASPFRDRLAGRTSEFEAVRFITPDVAVAHESVKDRTSQYIMTYVLSKKDGRWKVESITVSVLGNPGQGPPPAR